MQTASSSLRAQAGSSRIENHLRDMGFQQSEVDHNLYLLIGEVPLILVLYVDDLFLTEMRG